MFKKFILLFLSFFVCSFAYSKDIRIFCNVYENYSIDTDTSKRVYDNEPHHWQIWEILIQPEKRQIVLVDTDDYIPKIKELPMLSLQNEKHFRAGGQPKDGWIQISRVNGTALYKQIRENLYWVDVFYLNNCSTTKPKNKF